MGMGITHPCGTEKRKLKQNKGGEKIHFLCLFLQRKMNRKEKGYKREHESHQKVFRSKLGRKWAQNLNWFTQMLKKLHV